MDKLLKNKKIWLIAAVLLVALVVGIAIAYIKNRGGIDDNGSYEQPVIIDATEPPERTDNAGTATGTAATELPADSTPSPAPATGAQATSKPADPTGTPAPTKAKTPTPAPTKAKTPTPKPTATPTPKPTATPAAIDRDGVYTSKDDVALYIHTYGTLPKNYITKPEAKNVYGWSGNGSDKREK